MFKQREKTELIQKLTWYLSNKPEEVPEFLEIITNSLKQYKESVLQLRNSQTCFALTNLYFARNTKSFNKLKAEQKITFLIDPIFLSFPKGKVTSHCEIDKEILIEFVGYCKEVDILNNKDLINWLTNTKGQEYFNWVQIVLENN